MWLPRPAEFSALPPVAWPRTPYLIGFGRLRPGVSLRHARAEIGVLNRQYSAAHPELRDAGPGAVMLAAPFEEHIVSDVRPVLLLLFAAAGCVLLIACANIASLLLSRAASRSREFALRAALGAERRRLIRQLLAESVLLAVIGGGLGIFMAKALLHLLTLPSAIHLPRSGEIRLDGTIFAFAAALSVLTGILFGVFPAFRATCSDLAGVLRERAPSAGGNSRARSVLVMGQVALSVILLIGAALLLESLVRLQAVDPGFRPGNLLTFNIPLPRTLYGDGLKRMRFYQDLVRRVETLPGVRGAAAALSLPMDPKWAVAIQVVEQGSGDVNDRPNVQLQSVTPDFFRTLGIPVFRGRVFALADDTPTSHPVTVINEDMARRFWPLYPRGQSPVGQHVRLGNDTTSAGLEIVGVVANVHEKGLMVEATPEIYLPIHMNPPQSAGFVVRTKGDPKRMLNAVRNRIWSLDREQPISGVQTMDERLESSVARQRSIFFFLGLFATIALLLAAIGIYGAIAYSVAQRTRELGIRRALGAQQGDIFRLVVRRGMGMAAAGVAAGIAGALALNRLLQSLLFHVNSTDPLTFAGVAALFLVVAFLASYLPSRRATRIDPMEALRVE